MILDERQYIPSAAALYLRGITISASLQQRIQRCRQLLHKTQDATDKLFLRYEMLGLRGLAMNDSIPEHLRRAYMLGLADRAALLKLEERK